MGFGLPGDGNLHLALLGHFTRFVRLSFVLGFLILAAQGAEAAWLIDPGKFHVSAHGQTSCIECHENIGEQELHPNPEDVNKKLRDFFSVDKCLGCHDEVLDNLDEGMHGTKTVENRKEYEDCIRCHKPHTELSLAEDLKDKLDPAKPLQEQCGACHEEEMQGLPELSPEDEACMACHRRVDPDEPEGVEKIKKLCLHCHARTGGEDPQKIWESVPLIDGSQYQSFSHAKMACTACHLKSARFKHADLTTKNCRWCHLPHDEKVANDAHMGVTCEACHFKGTDAILDPESKMLYWKRHAGSKSPLRIHEMALEDDEAVCRRCHIKGNRVGAAAMILPAKSIICMPCHAATFSVGDTTTLMALTVFLASMVMMFSYWLSGSSPEAENAGPINKLLRLLWNLIRTIFSRKILLILKAMILDVILQRRLLRQSQERWVIHSLIFLPFVLRFFWGLAALFISLWAPEWPIWAMLDKNHPATSFVFDVTGVMILLGAGLAFRRGYRRRSERPSGLPGQDRLALGLIAGIVVAGFVLEGMRMSMTGAPEGAELAVVGYLLSRLFGGFALWNSVYGYLWYMHAILCGAFVAYLPFSRMFHIIMAPVALAMDAVSEQN